MSMPGKVQHRRPPDSLSAFVFALGEGSRCFCCGEPLRSANAPGSSVRFPGSDVAAVCPRCGSEVGVPEEEAEGSSADSALPMGLLPRLTAAA